MANFSLDTLRETEFAIRTAIQTHGALSPSAKLIGDYLWQEQRRWDRRAGQHGQPQGELFPSYQTLAMKFSLHRQTVIRAIAALEAAGFLHVSRGQQRANGGWTSNRYRVVLPDALCSPAEPSQSPKMRLGESQNATSPHPESIPETPALPEVEASAPSAKVFDLNPGCDPKDHDLRAAPVNSPAPPSAHTALSPARRTGAQDLLATHRAALQLFAQWAHLSLEAVAVVFAPHTDLDWRYAPAAAAALAQRYPSAREVKNPAGAMVTWLRNEPRWRPLAFVEGAAGGLPEGVVCLIQEAAFDKFRTAEDLARSIQTDWGQKAPAMRDILAAIHVLRPDLPRMQRPQPTGEGPSTASPGTPSAGGAGCRIEETDQWAQIAACLAAGGGQAVQLRKAAAHYLLQTLPGEIARQALTREGPMWRTACLAVWSEVAGNARGDTA